MIAGRRELMFKEQEYDVFKYGANSLVVGDYLTTAGKTAQEDIHAIEALGYTIVFDSHN